MCALIWINDSNMFYDVITAENQFTFLNGLKMQIKRNIYIRHITCVQYKTSLIHLSETASSKIIGSVEYMTSSL